LGEGGKRKVKNINGQKEGERPGANKERTSWILKHGLLKSTSTPTQDWVALGLTKSGSIKRETQRRGGGIEWTRGGAALI